MSETFHPDEVNNIGTPVLLTDPTVFLKAGESYFDPAGKRVIFQAIEHTRRWRVQEMDIRSRELIGSRSFSENPLDVIKLGTICINFYKKYKIATVVKHIPGQGLSKCDNHFKKPTIKASKRELLKKDFKPFKVCPSLFAMTCHAVFTAYDKKNTATHSKTIIDKVIRNYINFKGLLISDDISMKALKYDLKKNATLALDSGCNLVLHCNGKIKEMKELVKFIPRIDNFTSKKTSLFYNFLK